MPLPQNRLAEGGSADKLQFYLDIISRPLINLQTPIVEHLLAVLNRDVNFEGAALADNACDG